MPADVPTDDFALMEQIAARDESGLEQLYDRYSPAVFALCVRVLKDADRAEELLLEIFWEIWERADRYNPNRGAPRTYLMMLARSRAIDRRRMLQASRIGHYDPQRVETLQRDPAPGPQRQARQTEDQEVLRRVLEELPPEQKKAVELSFFEGLSHREIADVLETPLGTIKTQIRSGLLKLRDRLRTHYSEDADT